MNRIFSRFLFLLLAAISVGVNAQGLNGGIDEPVEWSVEFKKTSDTEGEIILTAVIDKGYDLYSQYNPPSKDGLGGGLPLKFIYKTNKDYALVGKTIEPTYKKHYNDIWESDEYFFIDKAVFKQKVKINTKDYFVIKGSLEGQACVEGMCKQTAFKFSVEVNIENKGKSADVDTSSKVTPAVNPGDTAAQTAGLAPLLSDKYISKMQKVADAKLETQCGDATFEKLDLGSLWSIFFLAFGAGLVALLMPCLFPLIPLNVSFFTKHSPTRAKGIFNAIIYGFSIIFVFVVPGYIITKIFGSDALNAYQPARFLTGCSLSSLCCLPYRSLVRLKLRYQAAL